MARTLDQLRRDALKLDVEERGALADFVAESPMTEDELSIQQAWIEEAQRRVAEMKAGKGKSYPLDEVMRKLRAKYEAPSRNSRRGSARTR